MARYVITGGTGFIGRALCRRLAARGDALTVLARDASRAAACLPAGVRTVSRIAELPAREPFDAVINLAGEPISKGRWSAARKRELEQSRIDVTRELVQWMGRCDPRPRTLLSASAVGYYGDRGDAALTETSDPHREYTHELCAAWENAAAGAREHGIRTAVLRIGLVLGPDGGLLGRMVPLFRTGLGGPMGSGRHWMSWIHREDLLGLIDMLLAREELEGVFNGTAPNPVTNRDFARTLGRVMHRPALLSAPAFAFRAAFGEMSRLLLTGQRVLPARALEAGFRFRFPELEAALEDVLST